MIKASLSLHTNIVVLLLICCLSSPALAHRVRVFAFAHGDNITAEVSLGSNQPVVDSKVTVTSRISGTILLQGQTDEQGQFSFTKPQHSPGDSLVITINAGQGHQGSWTLSPVDMGEQALPESFTTVDTKVDKKQPVQLSLSAGEQQQLAKLISDAVAHEVEPLKQMLARQMNNGPSLEEIIGGIGWLVGIGGLLFALKKK
jgi:nickel transport protein